MLKIGTINQTLTNDQTNTLLNLISNINSSTYLFNSENYSLHINTSIVILENIINILYNVSQLQVMKANDVLNLIKIIYVFIDLPELVLSQLHENFQSLSR